MMKHVKKLCILISILTMASCGAPADEAGDADTIVFGQTAWTSTEAPTQIAKQILEEVGYNVDIVLLDQPMIFQGMQNEEIDLFMDAWLPYTEEALWDEYQDDLQMVATSYENVPLGWVVPEYVEENTIDDLAGKADKFDGEIVTIAEGAGIVGLSRDVLEDEDYDLEGFELVASSEAAMLSTLDRRMQQEEPVIITGWRPHAMFSRYDLKFLEDTQGHFQYDNVYVLSYEGLEEKFPEVYDIMSQWSIEVEDLEEMMYEFEHNDVPFEESAAQWIEENRDQVDAMLGQ
ncbi:glycine betaine ABC transporter substrate-binding protein [Bacillus shivajii]|uniref:glycine betaine ABC transporter substrate-binding protein n=1 Tax=Bacillus shivajii TaxID=1983719 RepID=UPI001CFAD93A|nr:glycine betaine ABC transporter substrate-binding protein [Bacillus shivajii]UCZ54430.1 glycine betaine ABC transporter substrate-binding protein [Bacillus shivajii]